MQAEHVAHPGEIGHEAFLHYLKAHSHSCADDVVRQDALTWHGLVRCYQSHAGKQHDLLILGDSHAEHLFPGLSEALPDKRLLYYGQKGAPLINNPTYAVLLPRVIDDTRIPTVLLAARWSAALQEIGTTKLTEDLDKTIQALHAAGKKIFLADDVPEFPFEPQRCKYRRPLTQNHQCEIDSSALSETKRLSQDTLKSVLARHPEVTWISLEKALCDVQKCRMANPAGVLYRDDHHLNIAGSRLIAQYIVAQQPELKKSN
jgi:hypothetical protein